jgi:ABC-type sugar transport system ATPase subunit
MNYATQQRTSEASAHWYQQRTASLRQVSNTFDGAPKVVLGIDLDVAEGAFKVSVSATGRCNSTLLRLVATLDDPSGDDIIGRAIVRQLKVFVFDEPLCNPDVSLCVQMRIELARLHQKLHTTTICVTRLPCTNAPRIGSNVALLPMPNKALVFAPHGLAGAL